MYGNIRLQIKCGCIIPVLWKMVSSQHLHFHVLQRRKMGNTSFENFSVGQIKQNIVNWIVNATLCLNWTHQIFENRLLSIIIQSEFHVLYTCCPFLGYLFYFCVYPILRGPIMHSILYWLLTAFFATGLEARQDYVPK